MSDSTHQRIERLVARLGRRIRLQRATEGFITGATITAMLLMLVVVLFKTGWIDESALYLWGGLSFVFPLGLGFAGWLRSLDRIALAQRLDRSHALHDRLSTALELGEHGAKTPFEEAQIKEAAEHVGKVDPKLASPARRPTDLWAFGAMLVCLVALAVLRPPSHEGDIPQPPPIQHEQVLDTATLAMERDRLEAIKRELEGIDDPEAVALLEEIDQLLNEVENQEISEREFLDRLKKMEDQYFPEDKPMSSEETERVAEELKKAAEKLEKEAKKELEQEPAAQELVDAMKKKDLDRASKAMEKIANMLADKDLDQKQLERLAKIMEKLAKNIDLDDPALQKLMENNKKLIEQLQKKFDKLSDKDKQRLERAKQELEQQQKEQQKNEERESTRQLKKLRRLSAETSEKAEKVLKGGDGKDNREANSDEERNKFKQEAGRKAEEASEEMKQGGEQQKKDAARDMAKKQLQDMREAMQRSNGSRSQKQGGEGQEGQDETQRGQQMKEFLERAKGKEDEFDMKHFRETVERQGQGQGEGGQKDFKGGEGQNQQEGNSQDVSDEESNFAGKGEGNRELGEETRLDSKRVDQKVEADAGKGPSRSEIIKSASEEGFATTEYKDVYVDYSSVVEEVMDKEKIPAGYRFYVKRYFQLIQPQE